MRIAYHASHEQFDPHSLLEYAQLAESAGFQAAMCSDHFSPWSERQGNSGFAFSWLGGRFRRRTSPSGRSPHRASATIPPSSRKQRLRSRRCTPAASGSGEFLNEHITGDRWPAKEPRQQRLRECVDVMRALFAGEAVTHDGLVRSSQARLYVRPDVPPPLYAAALTPETATWAAEWADGLITAPGSPEQAREIIDAFRRAGGAAKPVLAQVVVAYAASDTEALAAAHDQWRQVALDGEALASLPTPQVVDAATADVSPQQVAEKLLATADLGRHVELLQQYAALGIDTVYVHNVTRDQRAFIAAYGRDVIPALAV